MNNNRVYIWNAAAFCLFLFLTNAHICGRCFPADEKAIIYYYERHFGNSVSKHSRIFNKYILFWFPDLILVKYIKEALYNYKNCFYFLPHICTYI